MKFDGGIYRDSGKGDTPQGTVHNALNGIISVKMGAFINEPGNSKLTSAKLPNSFYGQQANYTIVHKQFVKNNQIVVFSIVNTKSVLGVYSEIGVLKEDGEYEGIVSFNENTGIKFDLHRTIDSDVTYNDEGDIIIVWTDGNQDPRVLNITKPAFGLDKTSAANTKNAAFPLDPSKLNQTKLFPDVQIPDIHLEDVYDTGGNQPVGSKQLFVAYLLDDGTQTNYVGISRPVMVHGSNSDETFYEIDGGDPNANTSKRIEFLVDNLDPSFDKIRLAILENTNGQEEAFSIGDYEYDSSFRVVYSGTETKITVPTSILTIDRLSYKTAKTLRFHNRHLFVGNVSKSVLKNYQPWANRIRVRWVADKKVGLNGYTDSHKNAVEIYDSRGFMPGEVVALYIKLHYLDGTSTDSFHIPGRPPEGTVGIDYFIWDTITSSGSNGGKMTVTFKDPNVVQTLSIYGSSLIGTTFMLTAHQDNYDPEPAEVTNFTPDPSNNWVHLELDYPFHLGKKYKSMVQSSLMEDASLNNFSNIDNKDSKLSLDSNASYYQLEETAYLNGAEGYWENKNEPYPNETFDHKVPIITTLNDNNSLSLVVGLFTPIPVEVKNSDIITFQDGTQVDVVNTEVSGSNLVIRTARGYLYAPDKLDWFTYKRRVYPKGNVRHHKLPGIPLLSTIYPDFLGVNELGVLAKQSPENDNTHTELPYDTDSVSINAYNGTHTYGLKYFSFKSSVSSSNPKFDVITESNSDHKHAAVKINQEVTLSVTFSINLPKFSGPFDPEDMPRDAKLIVYDSLYEVFNGQSNAWVGNTPDIITPTYPESGNGVEVLWEKDFQSIDMEDRVLVSYSIEKRFLAGQYLVFKFNSGNSILGEEFEGYVNIFDKDKYKSNSTVSARSLGLLVDNIEFPSDIKNEIQSYEILYAKRDGTNSKVTCNGPGIEDHKHENSDKKDFRFYPFDILTQNRFPRIDYIESNFNFLSPSAYFGIQEATDTDNVQGSQKFKRVLKSKHYEGNLFTEEYDNGSMEKVLKLFLREELLTMHANLSGVVHLNNCYLGFDKQHLASTGKVFDKNQNSTGSLYGGDTYISLQGIVQTADPSKQNVRSSITSDEEYQHFMYPVWTINNVGLRHRGSEWNESYHPKTESPHYEYSPEFIDNNLTKEELYGMFANYYGYNKSFAAVQDTVKSTPTKEYRDVILFYQYLILKSLIQQKEGVNAGFRNFLPIDYYSMDQQTGSITNLESDGNELLIHTETGLYKTVSKTRIKQGGDEVVIGSGNIFSVKPQRIIPNETGYAGTRTLSGCLMTKMGYLFVSHHEGKIFLLGQQLREISAYGMREWFQENLQFEYFQQLEKFNYNTPEEGPNSPHASNGVGFTVVFDEEYNRIIITKRDFVLEEEIFTSGTSQPSGGDIRIRNGWPEEYVVGFSTGPSSQGEWLPATTGNAKIKDRSYTISFSLNARQGKGAWASFHSYKPGIYLYNENNFFSALNGPDIYIHNDKNNMGMFFGLRYATFVDPVVRDKPGIKMMLQSISWICDVEDENINHYDKTLTHIGVYNNNQSSGLVPVIPFTNARNEENKWNFNKFRDIIKDRSKPFMTDRGDFITNNHNSQMAYYEKRRFRDTFFIIRLQYDNTDNKFLYLYELLANVLQAFR